MRAGRREPARRASPRESRSSTLDRSAQARPVAPVRRGRGPDRCDRVHRGRRGSETIQHPGRVGPGGDCGAQGLKVGWISSRPSPATTRRAKELKIDFLRQEKGSKVCVVESLLAQTGFRWDEVCYVGDDIVDLGVLKRAGVAVAVANGVAEARAAADYVTSADGGHGAVREVVELILQAQNKWARIVAEHAA